MYFWPKTADKWEQTHFITANIRKLLYYQYQPHHNKSGGLEAHMFMLTINH